MSVDIGQAIEEGGKRTVARNGLYLVVVLWALGVLSALFGNTVARGMFQQFQGQLGSGMGPGGMGPGGFGAGTMMGPSLGLSPGLAWVLSLVVSLVSLVVAAGALRTFVTDDTETLPGERFTRNLGWMLVNLVVGGIIFGIAVGIGFVLLVIPGLFLLVSLFFWAFYVAVEDENFWAGFQNSWALTRGNRIMLFVLGVVVAIISIIISWVFGIPQLVGLTGWIGLLVAQFGSALGSVFVLATASRTFLQLAEDEDTV